MIFYLKAHYCNQDAFFQYKYNYYHQARNLVRISIQSNLSGFFNNESAMHKAIDESSVHYPFKHLTYCLFIYNFLPIFY